MNRLLTVSILVFVAACGSKLAKVEQVRDLRVLAVRADPPEVFVDADPSVDVLFSALVVDPRQPTLGGTPLSYTFSFCPVESDEACIDFEQRRAAAPPDSQALLDGLHDLHERGSAGTEADAQNLTDDQAASRAVWPYAIIPYELQLTQGETRGLAEYFFATNLLGFAMGALPSVVLDVAGVDDAIASEKRFTFNVRDVGAAAALGFDFGYRVCDSGEDESGGCVALRPRERNTNPTFDRIQVAQGSNAAGAFDDIQTTGFAMRASSAIRILPVFTGDSYEAFQELVTDPATGRISARDRVETLSVAWFATAGSLQDAVTTPLTTKSLDTEYRSPGEVPPEGLGASVFMVARDQRGGVAWQSFEILVIP